MSYYRCVGKVPRKRHSVFRDGDGGLMTEELVGEQGFFHASSLLYHRHLPNLLVAAEPIEVPALTSAPFPNVPLIPRKLDAPSLPVGGDAVTGRHPLLLNDDVRLSYVAADEVSPLFRNALGDELVFLQEGTARLESIFGVLDVSKGDYVRVPMGCVHRWVPRGGAVKLLIIEARGHIGLPPRYLSPRGQLLEHAPYCERDFRAPSAPIELDEREVEVLVRHPDGVTRHVFGQHPFDVVGWDGCVYPFAFSIYDFEPIVKRFHAPPPTQETFTGANFVVCSFCPRPVDFDPAAVPAPYAHSAVDCDEIMFFVEGNYAIRAGAGVRPGSLTFHPAGFVHGPHPGGAEASLSKGEHDDYAVMIDTFRPLSLGASAAACSDSGYHTSWWRAASAAIS